MPVAEDASAKIRRPLGIRVMHVAAPGRVGGLESVVEALVSGLHREGVPVALTAVLDAGTDEPEVLDGLRRAGMPVYVVRTGPRGYGTERRKCLAAAAEFGATIVHTHGYRPDVVTSRAARRAGAMVVSTAHGFTGGGWRNRFYEWLQTRAWRHCDKVVAVSRPLREELLRTGMDAERVTLLPNAWPGMDGRLTREAARARLGLPTDAWVIGWVGRLSQEKGPDLAVRALAALPAGDVVLCLVGDGAELEPTRQLARELGVADRVHLVGVQPRAGELFMAFDAFLLSSRTEGTPIVVFEAMAASVPMVLATVGGVPDVVSSGAAWLVPPLDVGAMAAALAAVRDDPEEARHRASHARRILDERYAPATWVRRHLTLYETLMRREAGT